MRKLAVGAIVGVLVGAIGAVAVASNAVPSVTIKQAANLTAGSPSHPRGVRLNVNFSFQGLPEAQQPIVTNLNMWFPRGSVFNGNHYPICSFARLSAGGPTTCPKGSIMGSGLAIGYADTTITRPTITVVNGGASIVYFYIVLNNPARVQEPVVGHITRTHGDYTYHLSATIPENLRIVAGVPIEFTYLHLTAGRGNWLALSGPPAGVKASASFNNGATIGYQLWIQNT